MINNKNNLLMIISISLVVAIVVSIATINITGEVIRQHQDRYGKYKVYTTEETYNQKEISTMMLTCEKIPFVLNEITGNTCDSVCKEKEIGKSCKMGSTILNEVSSIISCDTMVTTSGIKMVCLCC